MGHSQAMTELERFVRAPTVQLALARERDRMVRAARDLAVLKLVSRLEAEPVAAAARREEAEAEARAGILTRLQPLARLGPVERDRCGNGARAFVAETQPAVFIVAP